MSEDFGPLPEACPWDAKMIQVCHAFQLAFWDFAKSNELTPTQAMFVLAATQSQILTGCVQAERAAEIPQAPEGGAA